MESKLWNLREVKICDLKKLACYEKLYKQNSLSIQLLAENIRKNGLLQPIEISSDNIIVSGHRRVESVELLGWKTIHAIQKDFKNQDEMILYHIRSNNSVNIRRLLIVELFNSVMELRAIYLRQRGRKPKDYEGLVNEDSSRIQIARDLGISEDKVKKLIKVGKTDLKLIECVDKNIISLNQAYELAMGYAIIQQFNAEHKTCLSQRILNEEIGITELYQKLPLKTRAQSCKKQKSFLVQQDHDIESCPICTNSIDKSLIASFINSKLLHELISKYRNQ